MKLFVEHEWSFDKFHQKANRLYRAILVEPQTAGDVQQQAYQPLPLGSTLQAKFPEIEQTIRIFTGGVAFFIALLTVSPQALKAALANPVEALRYE